MLFKEYTYSVLIVSSSAKFNEAILPLLPENEFGPIKEVKTTGEARRILADRNFDILLVNTPLTDSFGTRFALDAAENSMCGVLMFVKADLYEEITDKVIDYGIFTLSKPTSSGVIHRRKIRNRHPHRNRIRKKTLPRRRNQNLRSPRAKLNALRAV